MVRKIYVRIIIDIAIDPDAWTAAAIESEYLDNYLDDVSKESSDYDLATYATGYIAADDKLPRWARGSMEVIKESLDVQDTPYLV